MNVIQNGGQIASQAAKIFRNKQKVVFIFPERYVRLKSTQQPYLASYFFNADKILNGFILKPSNGVCGLITIDPCNKRSWTAINIVRHGVEFTILYYTDPQGGYRNFIIPLSRSSMCMRLNYSFAGIILINTVSVFDRKSTS